MDLTDLCNYIHYLYGVLVFVENNLLRDEPSLVLHEIQSIDHIVDGYFPVNSNTKQANYGRLEGIVHREGGALSLLHVEGHLLKSAHMEEGLVLDSSQAGVVQKIAEHKVPWLLSFLSLL